LSGIQLNINKKMDSWKTRKELFSGHYHPDQAAFFKKSWVVIFIFLCF